MSRKPFSVSKVQPICPYCNEDAKMVSGLEIYKEKSTCSNLNFWVCWCCDAYVGCHTRNQEFGLEGTEPLGSLANKQLRRARMKVHIMFDPLWEVAGWGRTNSYRWLAKRLGIPLDTCHVGKFNLETCVKAITALAGVRKILNMEDKEDTHE